MQIRAHRRGQSSSQIRFTTALKPGALRIEPVAVVVASLAPRGDGLLAFHHHGPALPSFCAQSSSSRRGPPRCSSRPGPRGATRCAARCRHAPGCRAGVQGSDQRIEGMLVPVVDSEHGVLAVQPRRGSEQIRHPTAAHPCPSGYGPPGDRPRRCPLPRRGSPAGPVRQARRPGVPSGRPRQRACRTTLTTAAAPADAPPTPAGPCRAAEALPGTPRCPGLSGPGPVPAVRGFRAMMVSTTTPDACGHREMIKGFVWTLKIVRWPRAMAWTLIDGGRCSTRA